MLKPTRNDIPSVSLDAAETKDWMDSLDDVLALQGPERARQLLYSLQIHAQKAGVKLPVTSQTPYVNTISLDHQPPYPGDRTIERRIKSIIRWNAAAMVVRANRNFAGIGGHISSYSSAATLYEVAFNHFFRGPQHDCTGDLVFFQGHLSPGIYARAYLEGRLTDQHLLNFRRELAPGGGLSSYPHPWLMPDFWQVPTVSMGLGPIQAIYQARYMRYLSDRGVKPYKGAKVWAFLGDGETDEPEALGAISLASREKLSNLIFVINCNLQRLDGPVRGNGNIVQELEANFRGSGWKVIKCLWGGDWDPLLANDTHGFLARRMGEVVDGQYQKYAVEGGTYIRKDFWGANSHLMDMVKHLRDDQLWKMRLGGHDPDKVYAAFKMAQDQTDQPTVILTRTIKGYGLGEAGEGKNITHQQKKMNEQELLHFRDRFDIPLTDAQVAESGFYKPAESSIEMQYLRERRQALGGWVPQRLSVNISFEPPGDKFLSEFSKGTGKHEVSTTMAFVRILNQLLKEENLKNAIVPIVPDEARTFGMEGMFRQFGIYSHVGQLYEPVDANQLMFYREAKDGIILEEGINEAGAMSSFMASGTSYSLHGVPTIPFFIFYSMFGPQRVGDLIWAAGDMRCKGFLIGGTAGRTALNGEGLQHQDGHSHVLASTVPNLLTYDPAYAYELAVIIRDGIRRMYQNDEAVFYYITVTNENYTQPEMPLGCEEGILKGIYRYMGSKIAENPQVHLLGSGPLIRKSILAKEILEETYGISADVYSVTSYTNLRREALDCERWNLLHPDQQPKEAYVSQVFKGSEGVFVAVSDYMKILPDGIARWLPGELVSLGTDGYGRSETRDALRDFFEIDERYIVLAALRSLAVSGRLDMKIVTQAMRDMNLNPEKTNPMHD